MGMRRTADLVFGRAKVVVFLDGCFWHGCPEHFKLPSSHVEYWTAKIGGNVRRDRSTDQELVAAGWQVIRIWEHEDPVAAARTVAEAVRARQSALSAAEHTFAN